MGKSNNLYNKFKSFYQRENNLNDFLEENEIKILENINNYFIHHFIIELSSFIKKNVQLASYSMKIGSYNPNINNIKNIKNLNFFNLIEILPYKNESSIIFSYNFLSVMIDLLFGGRGNFASEINTTEEITSTELFINQKIIKFIINILSDVYKKYFSSEINFVSAKIVINSKKPYFDSNKVFLINCFNFNINQIEFFLSILIPVSIFNKINKKKVPLISEKDKEIHLEKKVKKKISFNNIYDVELNIISRIIGISISYDEFCTLSVGDILSIKKPDKIVGFIENKPIFFGDYKRFNEQTVVFIEEFINNNADSNEKKESSNE